MFVWVFLFFYLIVIVYLFFWMVMSVFKNFDDIFEYSWLLLFLWYLENFVFVWNQGIFFYFMNSVIVMVLMCVIIVFISVWVVYGFFWFEFKGKGFFLVLCFGGLMLMLQVSFVLFYFIIQLLGLYNMYWVLILLYVVYWILFIIILICFYFFFILKELEEVVYLDGCISFGVFFRIFLLMSVLILVIFGILMVYYIWNEFMFVIIFIDDENLWIILVGLMQFRDVLQIDWGVLLVGLMILVVLIIILFLLMQKYFVCGIVSGSVKG